MAGERLSDLLERDGLLKSHERAAIKRREEEQRRSRVSLRSTLAEEESERMEMRGEISDGRRRSS